MTLDDYINDALCDTRRSLRLVLRDTRNATDARILEVFPHRLEPAAGKTRGDAVRTLIADLHMDRGHGPSFWDFQGENWTQFNDHPDCTVMTGALFLHQGDDSNGVFVETDADHIYLPGGETYVRRSFTPNQVYQQRHCQRDTEFFTTLTKTAFNPGHESDVLHSLALGALSSFLDTPYQQRDAGIGRRDTQTPHDIVSAVVARANRVLINKYSGQEAMNKGLEFGRTMVSNLELCWFFRPDRGFAPNRWISTPQLEKLFTWANPTLFDSGKAMVEAAKAYDLKGSKAVYDTGKSAHEAIMTHQGRSMVDDALFANCSPEFLKPRAAATARKTQGLT